MVEKTKVDTVLDEVFKKTEFKLYCKLDRADIGEKLALMDFFKELRIAKDKLICKYKASDELAKLQCNLKMGNVHVIVVKEVIYWRKLIERRMRKTPRLCSPYRIDVTVRVSEEIFLSVKEILNCLLVAKYGLEVHETNGIIEIKIWSKRRLELFFKNVTDLNLPRKIINDCTVELIVSEDKMFMLRYRKTTETLNITSYYGVWNKHLVPQHL